ncbi:MAG: Stp1/IreP family PP2C-type Ser/Thr phosphatase [Atopobiaceae bacterium]|nr:Stp1/IreP family PP2C-type Ser/Thr phosphatase [Atopobiaceae bacterium]
MTDSHQGDDLDANMESEADRTQDLEPIHPATIDVNARVGADVDTGGTTELSWGARSDVGLVRGHNEDAFLVRSPLFCVCDGMGGHAAGEVASSIAIHTIADKAPIHADDVLLGAAVEAANVAVIDGAEDGRGKPGMGCTATAVYFEGDKMAVAHVGDSRVYLLHAGTLVRITHDHSYVEELVDAGEITADEARVHPSRSIITRALGSDPDMYADHFTLDVEKGDRVILCSDGLSSMVADSRIEAIAVSCALPQECVDALVSDALAEGGHDNVTVVAVDIINDGREDARRRARRRSVIGWLTGVLATLVVVCGCAALFINNSWYVGNNLGTVGIYQGVDATLFGFKLSHLSETTSVSVADLPEVTQRQLSEGITVDSIDSAKQAVESYRQQIDSDKTKAAATAGSAQQGQTEAATTQDTTVETAPAATEGGE